MSPRVARVVLALSALVSLLHPLLVRAMAEGHVAHQLLGAGNKLPPLSTFALVVSLLAVRLLAIVIVPGAVLAALASLLAEHMRKRSAILPDR